MTVRDLIEKLLETTNLDEEVGISFEGGWSSIKDVFVPKRSGIGQQLLIEAEDTLYDRQTAEVQE